MGAFEENKALPTEEETNEMKEAAVVKSKKRKTAEDIKKEAAEKDAPAKGIKPVMYFCKFKGLKIIWKSSENVRDDRGRVIGRTDGMYVRFDNGIFIATEDWHVKAIERYLTKNRGAIVTDAERKKLVEQVTKEIDLSSLSPAQLREIRDSYKKVRAPKGKQGTVGAS